MPTTTEVFLCGDTITRSSATDEIELRDTVCPIDQACEGAGIEAFSLEQCPLDEDAEDLVESLDARITLSTNLFRDSLKGFLEDYPQCDPQMPADEITALAKGNAAITDILLEKDPKLQWEKLLDYQTGVNNAHNVLSWMSNVVDIGKGSRAQFDFCRTYVLEQIKIASKQCHLFEHVAVMSSWHEGNED